MRGCPSWPGTHSLSRRVTLSPRQGLPRIPLRGIFQGAKVVRGPDWEWGSQDGEWGPRVGRWALGCHRLWLVLWRRLSLPVGPLSPRRGREARPSGGHPWLGCGDGPERGQRDLGRRHYQRVPRGPQGQGGPQVCGRGSRWLLLQGASAEARYGRAPLTPTQLLSVLAEPHQGWPVKSPRGGEAWGRRDPRELGLPPRPQASPQSCSAG